MSRVFEPTEINGMKLANRFVRSATWEGMASEDGTCTPGFIAFMRRLAEGGVGLIITGLAYITRKSMAAPWQLGIDDEACLPGLKRLTDAVHGANGRIAIQIAHGGCYSAVRLTGEEALAPSDNDTDLFPKCRAMTKAQITEVVEDFAISATLAKRAGFDAVQIHAAHGYLLSQFLSPFFNKRQDEYGGSIENRARIVFETLRAVRNAVGEDYPVLIKINSEDFVANGLTVGEMLQVAAMLEGAGIDAIEMSGGTVYASGAFSAIRTGSFDTPENEVLYREAAIRFKKKIGVPLMLVGAIRSFEVAETMVSEGVADYISLSRPFIREPALINRWKAGDLGKAACISDNACFGPLLKGDGLNCVREPASKL